MAVVILGGLITSTLLSLFVLPVVLLRFGDRRPTRSPEQELMKWWVSVEGAPTEAAQREPAA